MISQLTRHFLQRTPSRLDVVASMRAGDVGREHLIGHSLRSCETAFSGCSCTGGLSHRFLHESHKTPSEEPTLQGSTAGGTFPVGES